MASSLGGESSSGSDTFNSTPQWEYDVFLSFAGKDTRLNFTVLVISQNYAKSTWCLDELQKFLNLERNWVKGFPIFYNVNPADVREQRGSFGKSWLHLKRNSKKLQQKCRVGDVLCQKLATCLAGSLKTSMKQIL
ncbi:hypothetical protein K1719_045748 [Acacia pycnantha]|nr:hypothetical protein K1719_045748 [Acacia pycnantha]